jgi:hypothetical protein
VLFVSGKMVRWMHAYEDGSDAFGIVVSYKPAMFSAVVLWSS